MKKMTIKKCLTAWVILAVLMQLALPVLGAESAGSTALPIPTAEETASLVQQALTTPAQADPEAEQQKHDLLLRRLAIPTDDALSAQQNADGGFGLPKLGSDVPDTLLALGVLPATDAAAQRAAAYLLSVQNADGGFGYAKKAASEAHLTAQAVLALQKRGSTPELDAALSRARQYLTDYQAPVTYRLTVSAEVGGKIIRGTSGDFAQDATIELAAAADEGYRFTGWSAAQSGVFGDASLAETIFTMPAAATAVTAHFEKIVTYALQLEADEGGSITAGAPGSYAQGAKISLAVEPATGYKFVKWQSSDGGSFASETSARTEFTMPAHDTKVRAVLEKVAPVKHKLTIVAGEGGQVTTGTSGSYAAGEEIKLVAAAKENYIFDGWTVSAGDGLAHKELPTTTFTMPDQDVTVTATFKAQAAPAATTYKLTFSAGTGGKITTTSGKSYEAGKTVVITATPNSGYRFTGWTSTNGGTFADDAKATTTFTMPKNATTVKATFARVSTSPNTGDAPVSPIFYLMICLGSLLAFTMCALWGRKKS